MDAFKPIKPKKLDDLRKHAVALLNEHQDLVLNDSSDQAHLSLQNVIEQMRIYEAELEIQNNELIALHEKLSHSQRKLQQVFEQMPVAVVLLDERGVIQLINNEGLALFGIQNNHLALKHSIYRFFDANSAAWIASVLMADKEAVFDSRLTLKTFDVEKYVAGMLMTRHFKESGLSQNILTLVDISDEQKRLELENNMVRDILESQNHIILVLDTNQIVEVSGGFFKYFRSHTSIGSFNQDYRSIEELFVDDPGYFKVNQDLKWFEVLLRYPNRVHKIKLNYQGRITIFSATAVKSVKTDRVIVSLIDITESENIHRQLMEQIELAQQANAAKSMFLANMSHEIRTPLNGIIGLSELGLQESSPYDLKTYLKKISLSGRLLLGILNDILDFSKIEAGKLEIVAKPFHFPDVITHLRDIFSAAASEKQLDFDLYVDNKIKQYYLGDELRINQVLINIIGNAIKFTKQGHVKLHVLLESVAEGADHIRFIVCDTGIGMSKTDLAQLFQSFSQVDNSITREFGGTGLGLVISQNLVYAMNGSRIEVTSKKTQGSEFSFVVPLLYCTDEQIADIERERSIDQQILQSSFHPLMGHVLLVEDNQINQEVAQKKLLSFGLTVSIAEHGQQAIQRVAEQKFDLILMDVQMPVMGGYEATRHIRQTHKDIPIIALTAAAMIEDKNKALEVGMNDHLSKPLVTRDLYKQLARFLPQNEEAEPIIADTSLDFSPALINQYYELSEDYVPWINVRAGLHRVNQDYALYFNLLEQFLSQCDQEFKALESLAADESIFADEQGQNQLKSLLHTLFGVASNLSLEALVKEINQFTLSCFKGDCQGRESCGQLTQALVSCYLSTRDAVRSLVPKWASAMKDREVTLGEISSDESQTGPLTNKTAMTETEDLGHLKVLLVEDNKVNQIVVKKQLKLLGISPTIANNGLEAVALLEKNASAYDLIFMDLIMPEMGGIEATRWIRQQAHIQQPIIIALTGAEQNEDKQACWQVGMNGFLLKPLDNKKLAQILNAYFG
ncbi:sensory histidine kinase [Thiomicrospira aerophila AL3]|uniref:histidine kinase n=1 Tax=Thiomicrospira aerophila AL3 TaxID=717772 RepID=W0DSL2_9GAMM|nr:response regulator [Thiomicrospira aerophila]AHF01610.1 sensory histidine kinase [Thiomicrospira aerophila AL3]